MRKSGGMRAPVVVWLLRVSWTLLPFTLGDGVERALDGRSGAVVAVGATLAWSLWGVGLVASLVAHPRSLTVLRLVAPAAPVIAAALAFAPAADGDSALDGALPLAGVVLALAAVVSALSAGTADHHVDAASYGDERRFALRVPGTFVAGPVPLAWALLAAGVGTGPLLLAARSWIAGVAVVVATAAVASRAVPAFDGLSRRWLVFVPAGVTLVDHVGLVDPVLFRARSIAALGPAVEGTDAVDLTGQALGPALELAFVTPAEIVRRTSRAEGELQLVRAVLVTPGRPGPVLREAARRGIAAGSVAAA